ncbi:MAG: MGMT family protein [Euryarchaeota archaeon]|nr:MGMT family protein [Euryarchaeota archaeon]
MERRLYSYAGFAVEVLLKGGRVLRIRIAAEGGEGLPPLPELRVSLSGFTPFQRVVMRRAMEVPPGKVTTYALLARGAGYPGAARAVGSVMARNPYAIVVPCHRVVRSDLTPGNYAYGLEVKYRLLAAEGVEFEGKRIKRGCLHRF